MMPRASREAQHDVQWNTDDAAEGQRWFGALVAAGAHGLGMRG
jgi:hypothetical protein